MSVKSNEQSCFMKAKWDWATSLDTGKITEGRQIYRLNSLRMANADDVEEDYGFEVIHTKNKVRGQGNSLVLRFESEDGKDFQLLGWGLDMTAQGQ